MPELLARIEALLRRPILQQPAALPLSAYALGPAIVDFKRPETRRKGKTFDRSGRELEYKFVGQAGGTNASRIPLEISIHGIFLY